MIRIQDNQNFTEFQETFTIGVSRAKEQIHYALGGDPEFPDYDH